MRPALTLAMVALMASACRGPASPTAPLPKPIVLPRVDEETLPNGARLVVLENHQLPVVSVQVEWDVGSETDPPEKAGLNSLTAAMLRQGTLSHSAEEIAEAIEFVGTDLEGGGDADSTSVGVSVLRKDFPVGLSLLAEVVLSPSFPAQELSLLERQRIAEIRQGLDDPGELARQNTAVLFWGDGAPYARFPSERSIQAIGREDLLAHHGRWFGPEHATIAVDGDVDPSAALAALRGAFGGWKRGPGLAAPEVPPPKAAPGRRIRLVDREDLTQSTIRITMPGLLRSAPDYHAALLMNYVLGGGAFSSRLIKRVRSEEGMTYGIDSGFGLHKKGGAFVVDTSTRTEETVPTLDLVFQELEKMRSRAGEISPEELSAAKSNQIGEYPLHFETPDDVLGQLLGARLYGVGVEEITNYRGRVAGVSLAEARAAARRYLHPEEALVVVVGNASRVKGPLTARYGPVEVVDYRRPVNAVDREKP